MRRESVWSALSEYLGALAGGFRSVWGSCKTVLPYLLNVRSGDLKKEVTEQYPDPVSSRTSDDLPPRTRGLLVNDIQKCTGCGDCERICPVRCIRLETETGPDPSKTWVSVFDIDHSRCIFCGICVEVCQPASLTHSKKYDYAVNRLSDLVEGFGRGHVTNEQRSKWEELRQQQEEDMGDYGL